jgi:tRNA 2-thiouridine synthesizing protein A
MDTIDARGLSCPQPVILTQKAVSSGKKTFDIVVDSEVCLENVTRFVKGKFGKEPSVKRNDDEIVISVKL